MKIHRFPYGPIEANCYIVETENSLVMIDPCVSLSDLPKFDKSLKAIIVTHCHYDHVTNIDEIRNETKAPVYCHPLEFPAFRDAVKNGSFLFMQDEKYSLPDKSINDCDILQIDENAYFKFLHTPGHTMGSICAILSVDQKDIAIFTGDTLFMESAGRTDLGGDPVCLNESLSKLKKLDDSIKVYSGHGPETTIGHEKRFNPFM